MNIASELPPARPASEAGQIRFHGGAVDECEWCGRAVPRETALERVESGGDGVVVLCSECEFGTD